MVKKMYFCGGLGVTAFMSQIIGSRGIPAAKNATKNGTLITNKQDSDKTKTI